MSSIKQLKDTIEGQEIYERGYREGMNRMLELCEKEVQLARALRPIVMKIEPSAVESPVRRKAPTSKSDRDKMICDCGDHLGFGNKDYACINGELMCIDCYNS